MAKKKVLITVLAVALICVIAVAGTLAYLTDKANNGAGITNTFIAAGGGKLCEDFSIKETPVVQNPDGTYVKDPSASMSTSGIDYKVVPCAELPKDPTLVIEGKTEVCAYLYFEVVNNLPTTIFEAPEYADCWKKVDGVKGLNGGDVYVYSQKKAAPSTEYEPILITESKTDLKYQILKNNKIVVKNVDESTIAPISENAADLKFYGYLGQAKSGDNAKTVFEACEFVKVK